MKKTTASPVADTPKLQAVAAQPSRMSLNALIKGKIKQPVRIVLYGDEGVGKSTFAAGAPSPVFLGAEDGTSHLDVTRFPVPEAWADVIEVIRILEQESHSFKTLVIDSLDWIEPLLWAYICQRDGKADLEAYGLYFKGHQVALDEWRIFLAALERLWRRKNMNLILIAHSGVKTFKNPEGEDYGRYALKISTKAAGLVKEWSDAVLYATYETFANKEKGKAVKGVSTGARIIHTQRRAAFDAKNRYSLPDTLPLSWTDFAEAVEASQPADPVALMSEIQRKAYLLEGELQKASLDAIARANGDAEKLAQLNNWVNSKLIEKGIEQ